MSLLNKNDSEIKYFWKKKNEYLFDFEKHLDFFLNYDLIDEKIIISVNTVEAYDFKTKFTEVELINLVGTDDFNKFEKVIISNIQEVK